MIFKTLKLISLSSLFDEENIFIIVMTMSVIVCNFKRAILMIYI